MNIYQYTKCATHGVFYAKQVSCRDEAMKGIGNGVLDQLTF